VKPPRQIVCAKCGVGPEREFDRDGTPWLRCRVCGQEALTADVQLEAIDRYVEESTRRGEPSTKVPNALRRRWTFRA